jgi:hypothetical protein
LSPAADNCIFHFYCLLPTKMDIMRVYVIGEDASEG